MKILVTGSQGFLGTHLVNSLIADKHSVITVDRVPSVRTDVIRHYHEDIAGDKTSYANLDWAVENTEVIYHLAGASNINQIKSDPVRAISDTIMTTATLLDLSVKHKIKRFIFVSSVYVYGKEGHLYTSTKRCVEELCRDFHTLYGLPYTVLRYGPMYGEGGQRGIISILVRKALAGEPLIIHGDGKQSRHFIYVKDAVEASLKVLDSDIRFGVIMGAKAITLESLVKAIVQEIGNECVVSYDKAREDAYYEDCNEAIEESNRTQIKLGWEPKMSLQEGIKRVVESYI